ncbi:hypothetical protein [Bacillus smithii]|uniref:Uncharacterized protein n=2 Tax=Bacillaceae TaxID=186817 RepID=G9QH38_9BACI|nr:hypothetical protein [Bacillus smithii]EHL79545.1 hypothetical protein HMPREF1015_01097 [Bacillus smithii 7_3_47FAA]
MYCAHGVGYKVYGSNHEVRMKVEKQREKDHCQSKQIVVEMNGKLYCRKLYHLGKPV